MASGLEEYLESDNSDSSDKSNLTKTKKRFEYLHAADLDWRKRKILWEDFYDGYQWDGDELRELAFRKQPDTVINRIATSINSIVGIGTQLELRVKTYPRDMREDMGIADAMSEAIRYVEQDNQIPFSKKNVFKRGLITGRGWFHIFTEEDITGAKDIRIRDIDPDDIVFDRGSFRYDLSDAQDMAHFVWMPDAEILGNYPGKKRTINKALAELDQDPFCGWHYTKSYAGDDYAEKAKEGTSSQAVRTWYDKKRNRAKVCTYWYREREMRTVLFDEKIGFYILDKKAGDEDIAAIVRDLREGYRIEPQVIEKNVRISKYRTTVGNAILEEGENPLQNDAFPYIPFFCFREKRTGDHYGPIRNMIDPQREVNKRRSKALHILNSRQIEMEAGAVDDMEALRQEVARPDGIIIRNPNKELNIKNETSVGNFQLEFYNISSKEIDDVSGVNAELQGGYSNVRAASAIDIKRQQGMTTLSEIITNWKQTKLLLSQRIVDYIQEYWTPEKAIRILDDENKVKFMKFNQSVDVPGVVNVNFNEFATEKFDLIFDEASNSTNLADETFAELAKLAQTGMIPPELVIELSPLPFDTKQRLLGQLNQAKQAQAAQAQQLIQQASGGAQESASGVSPEGQGAEAVPPTV